jgi:DNA topoisomerase-1
MPPKRFFKKKSFPSSATPKPKKEKSINPNAKYLIIVESPSKCAKIESYLGDEYCCIASKGHIRTIEGLKSIDTKSTFIPKFSIIEEKQSQVEYMRPIISMFSKSNIILASDDDREGEAIAWHICEVFDLPVATTKRILFHEITKKAIVDAVNSPTVINMNLVQAQHARQVLDMVVGYKISPFLWKYLYHDKSNSLSAGRCQTPALRLVYDNDKEKSAGMETKYKTVGNFTTKNLLFTLDHEFDTKEEITQFLEKSKTHPHMIKVGSQKETIKSAPKPFSTSRLLQTASNVCHMSPKETMSICQSLYQSGYITYMRTDSTKYSKEFLNKASEYIMKEWLKSEYIGKLDGLELKDINNPHEAIRVTNINLRSLHDVDNPRMNTLYKLIWRNSVESCMADARYNSTGIKLSAPTNKSYKYNVEIPIFLGWKIVNERDDGGAENQNLPGSLLLYLQTLEKTGKPIAYNYIESTIVVRNKHQHYTEATLINTLEELGIGRPSTFATIVETIQDRGYVKRMDLEGTNVKCVEYKLRGNVLETIEKDKIFGNEKSKLVLQPVGLMTVEFLSKHFQNIFEYDYTKTMEDKLDEVSSGKETDWAKICKTCYKEIGELAKPMKNLEKQVFPIDETHDFVFEKFGPVVRTRTEEGTFEYKPVKKTMKIDLEKLKNQEYTLDELYEIKNDCLGEYEGEQMTIKNGKFGPYVEWGTKRESIKKIDKELDQITLEDVITFLENQPVDKSILRVVTPELSIRKGKFGAYAYYKAANSSKPDFYNIKKFPEGFSACDANVLIKWLEDTYKITIGKK